ncbi:MAG: N-acetylmuramic acid 6-phosphate etherase [Saprospiraceae bacterium]|nr:N-acetylmuramic acid 6-phosphate etherase [Saprospiraceae bacterium]
MFHRTTEQESMYDGLEKKSTHELLTDINREDQKVALAVKECLPRIEEVVDAVYARMAEGGRLFYIGAGTSGRLGILDASECPPTYGVPFDWVVGLIAGGDAAIRKAVENAEDSTHMAWEDLSAYAINEGDYVIGIAASGTTPYVIAGLKACRAHHIGTACITCNTGSPLAAQADIAIECVVGPEYVTGSTRMKSGTAQKLILNMISTAVMIKLGRVKGNRMVNMQLTNAKLRQRGIDMLCQMGNLTPKEAEVLLETKGSVKAALDSLPR